MLLLNWKIDKESRTKVIYFRLINNFVKGIKLNFRKKDTTEQRIKTSKYIQDLP